MIIWLSFTIGTGGLCYLIGFNSDMKHEKNPKHNGIRYLAIAIFCVGQSSFATNYYRGGFDEVFVAWIASLILLGPIAFGLGYFIRKKNIPKK